MPRLHLRLICGVEWPVFRQMIEKYRRWLEEQYGGLQKINERMVFAHNDVSPPVSYWDYGLTTYLQTQYGNILRMMPEGESPLLLPANQHKQLVVIDFEYANANVPGQEFANHFVRYFSSTFLSSPSPKRHSLTCVDRVVL
jgi:choline kinase